MKKYTDAELESLLDEVESDRIERKESWKGDAPEKSRQAVCAFSNDLPDHRLTGAYIQFVRFEGTELDAPIIDELLISGSLGDILRRIDDKIESHNRSAVDLRSASTELRQSTYPKAAIQQLIRNAVLHRTYESTNAPVRVYWFNDRIEIHNPGGPFGTVTVENFGTPGITDYRNPHIADAMKVLRFVQRFGVGIATAKAELAKNGNPPPEFTVSQEHVLATVRKSDPS